MRTVYQYIERKQAIFAQHPYFHQLVKAKSLDKIAPVAQQLAFWVMSFQDLVRLNAVRFRHPELSRIAHSHQLEDAGHEEWFLDDLKQMKTEEPSLRFLYSSCNAPTRDASNALISEVFRADNDYERIALLLIIESYAQVFFERVADFSQRMSYSNRLKYFSDHHLNAEESHESIDQELESHLEKVQLTQEEEKGIFEMLDRAEKAFIEMFDNFENTLEPIVTVSVK